MKDDKFLLVLMAILGFVSFLILKPFLAYVLFSIILTVVTYPLYEKIKSKLRFASLSAIILIAMIIIIIIVPSLYLTITIFAQSRDIITNIGSSNFSSLHMMENNLERLLGTELNFAETLQLWILDFSSTARSFVIEHILTFTRTIVNFFAGIALMFFIMFYLFIDGKRIVEQVKGHLPMEDEHKNYLFNRAYQTIQALFLGLFLTAVVQGALAAIGYFIFGMHNVVLLGFLTGIFSLIPFLGAPVIYVPVSLFMLLQGNLFGGIGVLLYGSLFISQIDNFIKPRFVRIRSKIHPLYVILGVVGGVAFLGLSGIVIGPLVFTLFQEVLDVYQLKKKKR